MGAQSANKSSSRFPHGDKFLGGSGVDTDGGVERCLGGAGLEGDAYALDNLAGVCADHVYAQDPVGVLVDDDLHQRLLATARQGVLQVDETGLVDFHVGVFLPGLFLGQAYRAEVGLAEYAGGDVAVIDAS